MMKGLSSTPWSQFFKKAEDTNQSAHLEIGEEALSLRFTFVAFFPRGSSVDGILCHKRMLTLSP